MKNITEIQPEVFAKAQFGEKDQLETIAMVTRSRLKGYVRRVTMDENVTEDIVQESMLEMFKVFGKIKNIDHLWGRLYLTANNMIKNHYGRQWRRATKYLSDVETEMQDSKSPDGLDDVVTAELKQIVNDSMKKLEPRQRAVMTMRCYEKMPFSKIAKTLDCSELAARALFFRAKKSLAKTLAKSGLGKASLVLALTLFGKLTATTEGAATGVTIAASTLKVGTVGTVAGVAGTKSAIATMAAAGIIAIGATVISPNNPVQIPGKPAVAIAAPAINLIQNTNVGIREHWYYYPLASRNIVMSKIIQYDEDGEKSYCQWIQNQSENYYFDSRDNTIYTVNHHAWSKDLRVAQLPTDPPALRRFIGEAENTTPDFDQPTPGNWRNVAGLLIITRSDDSGRQITDVALHHNMLTENYFQFDWPPDTKVIDTRDEIHLQGRAYFTIDGQIAGKTISGQGRIPLVYAMYERFSPWLRITIGEQTYTDRNSEKLFKGLSRPWQGLHTIDTIRRDAAKQRLPFKTTLSEDETTATVTVTDNDIQIIYTINMEKDLLEKIVFTGSVEGQININYSTSPQGNSRTPRGNVMPKENPKGISWLIQLANK